MNRLTEKISNEILVKNKNGNGSRSICYGCDGISNCTTRVCNFYRAIEKLAAYEDTGLEPEQIKKLFEYHIYRDLYDYITELLDLDDEGRLIKLPCKVGDTVYQIIYDRTIENYKVIGFEIDERGKLYVRVLIERPYVATIKLSYRKEDLYFSREEAEKALTDRNIGGRK